MKFVWNVGFYLLERIGNKKKYSLPSHSKQTLNSLLFSIFPTQTHRLEGQHRKQRMHLHIDIDKPVACKALFIVQGHHISFSLSLFLSLFFPSRSSVFSSCSQCTCLSIVFFSLTVISDKFYD
jgi:hypothetical protein